LKRMVYAYVSYAETGMRRFGHMQVQVFQK
jgi:hypothetical protein